MTVLKFDDVAAEEARLCLVEFCSDCVPKSEHSRSIVMPLGTSAGLSRADPCETPSHLICSDADMYESQLPIAVCRMAVSSVVGEGRAHKYAARSVTFEITYI